MGALALSGMLVAGSGVGAWAHECFNASRSEQGNASAGSHSQAWVTVAIADLIAGDVAGGLYSEEDGACIYEAYSATGSPLTFTLMVKGPEGAMASSVPRTRTSGSTATARASITSSTPTAERSSGRSRRAE